MSGRSVTHPTVVERDARVRATVPRGRLIGSGAYRLLLTEAGTGGAWLGDQALTAWRGDRVEDGEGWFFYVRDLDDRCVWSIGAQPAPGVGERSVTDAETGGMTFACRAYGIDGTLDVWIDPDHTAECRRLTLSHDGPGARHVDVTSYLEVVLHDPRHHAAHPMFSRLFLRTEWLADSRTLAAQRRPRAPEEAHPWLVQRVHGGSDVSVETDRLRFIGRGAALDAPVALQTVGPLAGTVGDVLDPVFGARIVLTLPPGEPADLRFVLAAAPSRDEALAIAARFASVEALDDSRRRAVGARRALAERTGGATGLAGSERLAAALLYRDPSLRAELDLDPTAPPSLVAPEIPGSGPLLVLAPGTAAETIAVWIGTTARWRETGFATRLAVLADTPAPSAIAASLEGRDDVTWLDAGIDEEARDALIATADLVTTERPEDIAPSFPAPERSTTLVAGAPADEHVPEAAESWPFGDEPLRAFNGIGGFSADGDEYVIRMPLTGPGTIRPTPRPWINVLANPEFGALVSETGAGCTWSGNSREFRITPWSNDPVRDPHDEALYLVDEESGRYWSPFPGPAPGAGPYEARHGFGATRFRHVSDGLELDSEVFVHARERVKVVRVSVTHRGDRPRRLSLAACQRLVLGDRPEETANRIATWADQPQQILMARRTDPSPHAARIAFAAPVYTGRASVQLGADRERWLGRGGSPARPAALRDRRGAAGPCGADLDPCFCTQIQFEIAPGETRTCAFLLGDADDAGAVGRLVAALRRPEALDQASADVRARWRERLGRLTVETGIEAIDLMVNGWLGYQALACRLWARTAHQQSGGAFGFRDQLQDAAAFLSTDPDVTRSQLLLHAAHQFEEGDVLHWWHPPDDRGLRTRFADDLLWMPLVAANYVRSTGDEGVLEERVPFVRARMLEPGEDEVFLHPEPSERSATLYEHCCLAVDRSLVTGPHGLPLFGGGDWNDGMNRVGREGRGESVWMAFFLVSVLEAFVPLCERQQDEARVRRYREHARRLAQAANAEAWDGAWYRRGYFDDGTPLGSAAAEECQIDALVQAWSVLSGVAPPERATAAMDAVERRLIDRDGLIRLLDPPFDRIAHDPGYIKGYLPGVRENGGQYTHAALWVIAAEARLGRHATAAELLRRISPVTRAEGDSEVSSGSGAGSGAGSVAGSGAGSGADPRAGYGAEPYVVAADVYSNPQHRGAAGWTWYTGSAGWMLRVVVESLLGVTLEDGTTLVIRPAIPPDWPGYRLSLCPWGREGRYRVTVRSSGGSRVVKATLDGETLELQEGSARVPVLDDGKDHDVEVELG